MGTMGIRAVLAGMFLVAAGTLGGAEAWPAGPMLAAPSQGMAVPNLAAGQAAPSPGLVQALLVRSCEVSLAAGRRDNAAASARRRECEQRHAAPASRRP